MGSRRNTGTAVASEETVAFATVPKCPLYASGSLAEKIYSASPNVVTQVAQQEWLKILAREKEAMVGNSLMPYLIPRSDISRMRRRDTKRICSDGIRQQV